MLIANRKQPYPAFHLFSTTLSKKEIVHRLSPLVTEEWGHFRLVLQELERRNLSLGNQRKDIYVNQLLAFQQKGATKQVVY